MNVSSIPSCLAGTIYTEFAGGVAGAVLHAGATFDRGPFEFQPDRTINSYASARRDSDSLQRVRGDDPCMSASICGSRNERREARLIRQRRIQVWPL
jgi:hypothetical protein